MKGIILKGIGGFYYVRTEDGVIECKARGKFRYDSMKPMVGDEVDIDLDKNNKGFIVKIHERSSQLIRPTVANVTQAYVVFAIKHPDINFDLLNRFLVLCEYNNIKAKVCLNKVDLCTEEEKKEIKDKINDIGYDVFFINAKKKEGLDDLNSGLKDNITVLCGPSGVGKSTLINDFVGSIHMETGNVSEKIGRGKHTTRHSEIIEINEGYLVDTPGFSTLDMNFINKDELKNAFPEFDDYIGMCKFRGCNHYKEPGCAVKEAVEDGKINKSRYEFYIKTFNEIQDGGNKKW